MLMWIWFYFNCRCWSYFDMFTLLNPHRSLNGFLNQSADDELIIVIIAGCDINCTSNWLTSRFNKKQELQWLI